MKNHEAACVVAFYRPFTTNGSGVALSRKTIGVKFNDADSEIFHKIRDVRNRVVAHSDEDAMHFRIDPFPMPDIDIKVPQLTFDDGLLFDQDEYFAIERLLHRMLNGVHHIIWKYTQKFPEDITLYKKPNA